MSFLSEISSTTGSKDPILAMVEAENRLAEYLMDVTEAVPYPVDAFPPRCRAMIEGYNRVYGAAPDHYGLSMITAVATALGNSICVKVKKELHPMIFFSIIVARPGSGKTPTINTVLRPIKKAAREKAKAFRQLVKEMKDEAKQRNNNDELILPDPEQPLLVSYTLESLYTALTSTPRGCLIHRDEAIAWIKSQDQYKSGGGDEAEFYLSAHNAEGYTISRKNLPMPIVIDAIQLNFLGGTQPGVLAAFAGGNNQFNGGLARILFSYPNETEYRPFNEDEPSGDYAIRWDKILNHLFDVLPSSEYAPDADPSEPPTFAPYEIELSSEATDLYRKYYDALQKRTAAEENDVAVDTLVKFRTHSLRIAGALHALEWAEKMTETTDEYMHAVTGSAIYEPISGETMDRALRIAHYHEFTSLKVINAVSSPAERLTHGRKSWYMALPEEGTRKQAIALAGTLDIKGLSARTADRLLKDKTLFDYRAGQFRKLH